MSKVSEESRIEIKPQTLRNILIDWIGNRVTYEPYIDDGEHWPDMIERAGGQWLNKEVLLAKIEEVIDSAKEGD
jgi:hypothetical protein